MNVKKLLESHKEIDDRIELGLEEIARLRSLAERVTQRISPDLSRGKGGFSDKVGTYAARIADLELQIDNEIDRLVDVREQIMSMMSAFDDDMLRIIIERRYILHESTEVIAEKVGYTPRHTARLLQKGLAFLEDRYGDTAKIA